MNKTAEKEDVDDYFENNGTYHDEKYVLQIQVIKVIHHKGSFQKKK